MDLKHHFPEAKKNTSCLICREKKIATFLDLGDSVLANYFLNKKQLDKLEPTYPLSVSYCKNCHLVQLTHIVDRRFIFQDYPYFPSASVQIIKHFEDYAKEIFNRFTPQSKQLVIEIGSSDGVLLKPLKQKGANVLGVDPAKNIVKIARKQNFETILGFFGTRLAPTIIRRYGKAGIITANNILAHTDDVNDMLSAVKQLLDIKGVFVFEVHYLPNLLQKNEFDNIYHEHTCYFSLLSLNVLLNLHSLQIFDVKPIDTQGGSIRVYASHIPLAFPVNTVPLQRLIETEYALGLDHLETYSDYAKRPPKVREKLKSMLKKLKEKGKKIVGYGASAKGNTLLQYCGIDATIIDYITDTTPFKQGKYTPRTHIPIVPPTKLKQDIPNFILLLAWNYTDFIIEQENWFQKRGGKFIRPVPEPLIL